MAVLNEQEQPVGKATPLDARANLKRRRQQPIIPGPSPMAQTGSNAIELALQRQQIDWVLETDFGRLDLYRSLALALGLEPPHRRAALWREIKARLRDMAEQKHLLPLWIIDEAQNLPNEFFRDLPAFINFAFDSQDLMTLWLVGHPNLAQTLQRAPYEALASRLQCHIQLPPIDDPEQFAALVRHGLQQAGVQQQLISDSGLHLLLMASRGRPRTTSQILCTAMKLAVPKGLNHLPDDLLQEAIEALR